MGKLDIVQTFDDDTYFGCMQVTDSVKIPNLKL